MLTHLCCGLACMSEERQKAVVGLFDFQEIKLLINPHFYILMYVKDQHTLIVEIKEQDHKSCDREADECLKGHIPQVPCRSQD